jgi:hypothetical protein
MAVLFNSHPPGTSELRQKADALIRDAFEAGRLHGYQQAERDMKAQLDGFAAQIQTSISQAVRNLVVPIVDQADDSKRGPEATAERASEPPPLAYGAKKAAVRLVMASSPPPGLKMVMVKDRVRHMHGLDLTPTQVREALRALQADGEVLCVDRTWWRKTDKLLAKMAHENGALAALPSSAPERGEAATSPIEKQAHFGLA